LTAHADEASQVTIAWQAAAVSDYRFRGASLSDGRPAVQLGVTARSPEGPYLGAWTSNIANYGGAHQEVDLTIGDHLSAGGVDVDISAVRYGYPAADPLSYWEIPVSVSRTSGSWTTSAGFAISPPQRGNLERTNRYVWARGDWKPAPSPVTLTAGCGWEDGGFARNKVDWTVGGSVRLGPLDVGLSYIGFDDSSGKGQGLIASVTFTSK
jgi:uncharacterized protein (TIGR02001 family)